MTQVQWVRRVVKPAAFLTAGVPFALLVYDILGGGLGANPIEEITHRTGFWTLTLLTITLSITPARKVLRLNALILLRRMFGVYAFFYACRSGIHVQNTRDRACRRGLPVTKDPGPAGIPTQRR